MANGYYRISANNIEKDNGNSSYNLKRPFPKVHIIISNNNIIKADFINKPLYVDLTGYELASFDGDSGAVFTSPFWCNITEYSADGEIVCTAKTIIHTSSDTLVKSDLTILLYPDYSKTSGDGDYILDIFKIDITGVTASDDGGDSDFFIIKTKNFVSLTDFNDIGAALTSGEKIVAVNHQGNMYLYATENSTSYTFERFRTVISGTDVYFRTYTLKINNDNSVNADQYDFHAAKD